MNLARRRLRRKMVAFLLTPVVAGFIGYGAVSTHLWESALLEAADHELADHLATLLAVVEPAGAGLPLQTVVSRVESEESVHAVALYAPGGAAIARARLSDEASRRVDEIARRALAGEGPRASVERIGETRWLFRAQRARGAPGLGAVVLGRDLSHVERVIQEARARLVAFGAVLALIVGALALWLAAALGRGLGALVQAADRVAQGDLSARAEAGPLFELGRVARAFNEMTASLTQARADLERGEIERRELDARMRRAHSLAIVGQVASSFAHEIGSPLNTILGWVRLAADDERLPPETRKQFATSAAQCERIARIVERMLATSRPPGEARRLVSLPDVVHEVSTFLAHELRARRVRLVLDLEENLPPISAARDRLVEVVMNLSMNAVQAQPGGGVLRIGLSREAGAQEPRVVLEVGDAGPGIPPDRRREIFEPFFSSRCAEGGTGLGLAIVADVVRELGGEVKVGEAPEGGALFRVAIPAGG